MLSRVTAYLQGWCFQQVFIIFTFTVCVCHPGKTLSHSSRSCHTGSFWVFNIFAGDSRFFFPPESITTAKDLVSEPFSLDGKCVMVAGWGLLARTVTLRLVFHYNILRYDDFV